MPPKKRKIRVIRPANECMIIHGDEWFIIKAAVGGQWQVVESERTKAAAQYVARLRSEDKPHLVIHKSQIAVFLEPEDADI